MNGARSDTDDDGGAASSGSGAEHGTSHDEADDGEIRRSKCVVVQCIAAESRLLRTGGGGRVYDV